MIWLRDHLMNIAEEDHGIAVEDAANDTYNDKILDAYLKASESGATIDSFMVDASAASDAREYIMSKFE